MTAEQIQQHKNKIDQMTHEEMARLFRFAPSGHPYFDTTSPLCGYFRDRFEELGGMTPEMSKRIGWSR